MAEAPEDQEAAQEEPSKGGAMKWIIISLVATLVLGGGGFAVWWFVLSGDDKKSDVVKKKGEGWSEAFLSRPIVSLKTFIVNLAAPDGRRYLKVKLDLELTTKDSEKELKGRLPEVRDQIILALSSKTYQQIRGIAGKTVLREELTARVNSVLKKGQVKKIYFTEFVVQ